MVPKFTTYGGYFKVWQFKQKLSSNTFPAVVVLNIFYKVMRLLVTVHIGSNLAATGYQPSYYAREKQPFNHIESVRSSNISWLLLFFFFFNYSIRIC